MPRPSFVSRSRWEPLPKRDPVGFRPRLMMIVLGVVTGGAVAERTEASRTAVTQQPPAVEATPPRLADYYGFLPPEIYKTDRRVECLRVADFDGDGVGDVAFANNDRGRIDFLLSSSDPVAPIKEPKAEPNLIASDKRMRLVSVPSSKVVQSLVCADFNGDGKPDIAYYGLPSGVVILLNQGGGKFTEGRRLEAEETVRSSSALKTADLNGDGKADLALLRDKETVVWIQGAEGRFDEPRRFPHTAPNPSILKLNDVNGDGNIDLIISGQDRDFPLRIRMATGPEHGLFGPEQRFRLDRIRALEFANLDGNPGDELLMIESQSGRLQVMALREGELDAADSYGRLMFYPMPEGSSRNRDMAVADLDGDGLNDVVVSDPANTQLVVHLGTSDGPGPARFYPSLLETQRVIAADLDGDGRAEVYVLSTKERQIGHAEFTEGRLSFPSPIALEGEPLAIAAGPLGPEGQPALIALERDPKANGGKAGVVLRGFRMSRDAKGSLKEEPLALSEDAPTLALEKAETINRLKPVDLDGDGVLDLLALRDGSTSTEPLHLFGSKEGRYRLRTFANSPLLGVDSAQVISANLDEEREQEPERERRDALLVARGSVVRHVALEGETWLTRDQFNTDRSTAQVLGVAVLDANGDGQVELVAWDRVSKKLLVLARRDGVFRPVGSIDVGPLEFLFLQAVDLNGDQRPDLLIAGADKFAVVINGQTGLTFQNVAGYESNREEARFADLIVGDANDDGLPDVVVSDTSAHFLEIVAFVPKRLQLLRGLAFKVFEQKSFRNTDDLLEPRQVALGDVDGDHRADLIVLVHDRILIYRQDSGQPQSKPIAGRE